MPAGVDPVIRFANPVDGDVTWDDLVKGPITISNHEIDDLILVRADGVPTYNFAVVVDDRDMRISHVFRGDEHVNNTPWQINLYHALDAPLPAFGHVPVILGDDGQKLSKRRGAVSVLAYRDDGYLPEAMVNYLARLGWSHGDEELFSREQLVEWFDTRHLVKSAAHWDPKKLAWVNNHYIKAADDARLATLLMPLMRERGAEPEPSHLASVIALMKDRCDTLVALADAAMLFYRDVVVDPALKEANVPASIVPALRSFAARAATIEWDRASIAAALKAVLAEHGAEDAAARRSATGSRRGTPRDAVGRRDAGIVRQKPGDRRAGRRTRDGVARGVAQGSTAADRAGCQAGSNATAVGPKWRPQRDSNPRTAVKGQCPRPLDDGDCDASFHAAASAAVVVEVSGIEPLTSCMPCKRSPS